MKKFFPVFLFALFLCLEVQAKLAQTVTFPAIANATYGDAPVQTGASASSGLPLTYSSTDKSIADVVAGDIVFKKAGTVTISAKQMGDATYKASPSVAHTFTIAKKDQQISFPGIADATFTDPPFATAATVNSPLALKYTTSNPTVATVLNGMIKVVGVGTVTITAKQPGNVNYNAAVPLDQTFTVNKKDQVITFPAIGDKFLGDAAFMAGASSSSGRPITYTSSNVLVAKVSMGEIRIKGRGTVTITTTLAGTNNYNAAVPVSQTFSVSAGSVQSGHWSDPATWGGNVIPSSSDDVTIRAGHSVLVDAAASCADLNVETGGLIDFNTSINLDVTGDINVQGILLPGMGSVTMTGAAFQTINGPAGMQFYDLTANSPGTSITSEVEIRNSIQTTNGSLGPAGAGCITLRSDADSTARIGTCTGSLTGAAWVIKRFIPGPASAYWQYMSTPINGNTVNDWDQDLYMSGVGGNDGNACCPTFFSVRTYNTASNTFSNVTSVNTALVKGKGYMTWLSDNMNALSASKMMDSRGQPTFGNVAINVTAGGAGAGYNLVGNPYACAIDYSAVVAESGNLNPNFLILQENGNYATNPNGGIIGPHQGFMAIATSTGPMKFTESAKVANPTSAFIKPGQDESFKVKLSSDANKYWQEISMKLNAEATDDYDQMLDAPFLESPVETAPGVAFITPANERLIFSNMNAASEEKEIPLAILARAAGTYRLDMSGLENLQKEYGCVMLEDKVKGSLVDLSNTAGYSFQLEPGDYTSRFALRLSKRAAACKMVAITGNSELEVYPNPATSVVNVKFNASEIGKANIVVTDITGRQVCSKVIDLSAGTNHMELSTTAWPAGIYSVQVSNGNNIQRTKLVKIDR